MAEFYTKGSSRTLVTSPREGLFRRFDFGEWTEMRMGMFVSAIGATGPNDVTVNETVVTSTVNDLATFGIKNSGQTVPGAAGSLFLGMRQKDAEFSASVSGGVSSEHDTSATAVAIGYNGTSLVSASPNPNLSLNWGETNPTGSAPYANVCALRFVISNRGLSTQSVLIQSYKNDSAFPVTDYSANALRELLNNVTWAGNASVAWNDGALAYAIPDCYWVRCPLFLNTIRIECIRAIRYAP